MMPHRSDQLFWVCSIAALAVKVFISWTTFGTNDVTSWIRFADYVSNHDIFSVYEQIPLYNHPPLVSIILKILVRGLGGNFDYFPQAFRMIPILSDLGSAIVIWKSAQAYFPKYDALRRTVIAVLSPILVMVSGFHGNTDPAFGFFLLLAAYLLTVRRNIALSALAFGLALNVKIVPMFVFPAFFFWLRSDRERLRFLSWTGICIVAGYGLHWLKVPFFLFRNVFVYVSNGGIWGFGHIFDNNIWYGALGIFLVCAAAVYLPWRLGRQSGKLTPLAKIPLGNGLFLYQSVALAYIGFLALTSGFGVQYLSWLASFVVFLSFPLAALYTATASVFLFLVYTEWSRGFPWHYADSVGAPPWSGAIIVSGYLTWACTLGAFVYYLWISRSTTKVKSFAEGRSGESRP